MTTRPGFRLPASLRLPRLLAALTLSVGATELLALPVDGDLDTSFGGTGVVAITYDLGAAASDYGTDVLATDGGRLLVSGVVATGAIGEPLALAAGQLVANGALDVGFGGGTGRVHYSFGPDHWSLVRAARTAQGEIVLAGSVQWRADDLDFLVVRLQPDGSLDPGFGGGTGFVTVAFDSDPGGENWDIASSLMIAPDGDILVAGTVHRGSGDWDMGVVRLQPGGALDPAFGSGTGKVIVAFDVGGHALKDQALAIFPAGNGSIVLVGACENGSASNTDVAFAMLDGEGHLLGSFGGTGKVVVPFDLAIGGEDYAYAGASDGRGRLYAAGEALDASSRKVAAIACVTWSGAPCPGFGSSGRVFFPIGSPPQGDERLTGIAVDSLGRIVAAGDAVRANRDVAIVRLLSNGTLDTSFAVGGARIVDIDRGPGGDDDQTYALRLVSGKPVVAGAAQYNGTDYDFFVLRVWVSLVFADGFETGSVGAWSSAQ